MSIKLEKAQTGLAAEFYVAGELSRLGYNVTITFGNTKSIDLLIQKESNIFKVQVKGIQASKSICWNLDKTKVTPDLYFVLVNLHVDKPEAKPDFFVLNAAEVMEHFTDTPSGGHKRTYLDYKYVLKLGAFKDQWAIFGEPNQINKNPEDL